jgi:hypothetical protein
LHRGGFKLSGELSSIAILETKGGNAATIKELVRRSAQFLVETNEPVVKIEKSTNPIWPLSSPLPISSCQPKTSPFSRPH